MKSNQAGFDVIDAMIRKINRFADPKAAAPAVAKVFDTELRQQIARGEAPDGTPWEKTIDGKTPLRNAGRALRVTAVGTRVVATLEGPTAMHHLGIARGHKRRQILPSRKMPERLIAAIKKALAWP